MPKINKDLQIMKDKLRIKTKLLLFRCLLISLLPFLPTLLVAQANIPTAADSIWAYRQAVEQKITLLKNKDNLLPLKDLDKQKVSIDGTTNKINEFYDRAKSYTTIYANGQSNINKMQSITFICLAANELADFKPQNNKKNQNLVLVFFGSSEALARLKDFSSFTAVVLAHSSDSYTQDITAQAIFGAIPFKGTLAEEISPSFKKGDGIATESLKRLKYTVPEELGIRSEWLKKADSIALVAIQKQATPSIQILVAKDGKVFYHKAFGYQTYDSITPANLENIYDLASVSKISTAIPALMKLSDEKKFDIDKTLADYFKRAKNSNKKNIVIRQILTHQSGLRAWIPFWQNTLVAAKNTNNQSVIKVLDPKVFQSKKSGRFPYQVAENLFIQKKYFQKNIVKQILESPIAEKKEYVYSDLSYYLYPEVIKKLTKKNVVDFLDDTFYKPLGASTLTYNPLQKFEKQRIIPTEYDSLFRKQLIQGYVHDEGAAMLGGISTHAGLFGTSNDLAKLLQMYLQNGYYGGKQYLSPEILAEFTRCQFCPTNLRGVGFDRQRGTNAAKSVSEQSYGHSGFTGNLVWIDPANGLLYIFLSNRVYPTRNNSRISDLNIRTDIQEVFYEVLRK
ncbi:MAG: hypothetical protein EAZ08_04645 [Cytophagales bacterium]|nr:MAG: hypothetical protein EAZ08_04645 [Cytophagales bacterium]